MVRILVVLAMTLSINGCGAFTDAATRLAYDIASAAKTLRHDGASTTLRHETPSRRGQCEGPYTVQLDQVGALVIWCKDDAGQTIASPGTSYHRRFVQTPVTYRLDKAAGEPLIIELERRGGAVLIVNVH